MQAIGWLRSSSKRPGTQACVRGYCGSDPRGPGPRSLVSQQELRQPESLGPSVKCGERAERRWSVFGERAEDALPGRAFVQRVEYVSSAQSKRLVHALLPDVSRRAKETRRACAAEIETGCYALSSWTSVRRGEHQVLARPEGCPSAILFRVSQGGVPQEEGWRRQAASVSMGHALLQGSRVHAGEHQNLDRQEDRSHTAVLQGLSLHVRGREAGGLWVRGRS